MAICLDYQSIYHDKRESTMSVRLQVLAAVMLLIALAIRVWIKVETTNIGYELAAERGEAVELDMQRRDLSLQRSVLLRPDQLELHARKRLGLKPLNSGQARKIHMSSSEGA